MTPCILHRIPAPVEWVMSRRCRIVVRGLPQHVTQRGNRRQRVFFADGDFVLRGTDLIGIEPELGALLAA